MTPLLPADIAEYMTPLEFQRLCSKVEHKYGKAFSILSVTKKDATHMTVEIELENGDKQKIII